ncbi:DivIVA domain protein [Actinomyces sp. oral taxon 848 str. F0332]|jgi:cell division protein, divIVA family|uniref:Cell wall synthesis protein Wag31 n=1 Tax=Peptidiphaga gingivicola TaxID=2741497 RepID=A0A179B1A2_9ACTO|nr:DivIVA domain-containing protein [Peptidiphaga gingivicola]EEZ77442.1 DivIVA domain protein [Actinomyces sp. oral taxon 848 str. F0332]OAP85290.1 cell division protein DivIVA [Peptidiphaga gingivicola]
MALLTESDVLNARFKAPSSIEEGYDLDQVDFFLDEVAETIAQLTAQKAELENELKKAQARIAELENSGAATGRGEAPFSAATTASFAPVGGGAAGGGDTNAVAGMLALAQQLHDKYISDGKAEADRILAEANAESQRIIAEAEEQHNRTLTQLEQERGLLERKISELRDFERDYRTRLKSYLESLLADVESGSTPSSDQR